jgi:peptidoglycan hydrolase-like protein with peptidoglycan-binding domain
MADYIYDYLENTESLKSKKTTQKSMGKTFLDKMKNVVNNYLSKSFGSLFGQTTLKDKFVSSLEKTNENFLVNSNDLLIEANTLEYKKGDMNYSDATAKFQLALQLLGFSLENWGVDGIFGPETKKAVKDFQKENNLKVTGVIDSITRRKIIDIVKTDVTDEDFMNAQFTKTESLPATDIKLTGDRFENFAIDKHSEDFLLKVQNIAKKVDLDYKIILAIMFFESEMNPSAQNPSSNATGLIQFMPTTAKSLGTSVSELKNMSAIDQLDYVEKFFMDKKRSGLTSKVKSPEEAYLLVFYPLAVTKSNDFILGSEISDERAKKIYSQNKPFDTNKDGFISKGEVLQYIRKKWGI